MFLYLRNLYPHTTFMKLFFFFSFSLVVMLINAMQNFRAFIFKKAAKANRNGPYKSSLILAKFVSRAKSNFYIYLIIKQYILLIFHPSS